MSEPLILQLKRKIEEEKVKELYYNASPSYTSATLNDSILNYDMIVVIGQSSDGYSGVGVCYKPTVGNLISVQIGQVNENATYNKQAIFKLSSKNIIESIQNYEVRNNVAYADNYIRIKAVLGINF